MTGCFTIMLGGLLGLITMSDYYHAGVFTVLVFYFFRGKTWWCLLGQLACLFVIHGEMLGGLVYELPVFGKTVYLHQQSLAVLSLIPIWLYQGKQGHMTRFMKYFNYFFYPAHMLILGLIQLFR